MSLKSKFEYAGKILAEPQSTRKTVSFGAIMAAALGLAYASGVQETLPTFIALGAAFTVLQKTVTGVEHVSGRIAQTGTPAAKTNPFNALKSLFIDAANDEKSTKNIPASLKSGMVVGAIVAALSPDPNASFLANLITVSLAVGAGTAILNKAEAGMNNALDKRYGYTHVPKATPAAPAA